MRSLVLIPCLLSLCAADAASAPWMELTAHLDQAEVLDNPTEIRLAERPLLLRRGWAVAESWPGEDLQFVWADAPRSVLEIPLARPETVRLRITMAPLNCPGCPPQTAVVAVNGHSVGELTLPPGGFQDHLLTVPAAFWRYRDNRLTLDWGRNTSPRDFDPESKDRRRLAAAVVRVAFESPHGVRASAPPPPSPEGRALRISADQAVAFYLRVPPEASLQGSVARDADASSLGAAGLARISIRVEGEPERELARRTLSGLSTSPRPLSVDLSPWAGRIARLSLRVEGSGPRRGLVARWERLRIEASAAAPPVTDALGLHAPDPPPAEPLAEEAAATGVIVYLLDALRAMDLGCYGSPAITSPFVDRLSREGALLAHHVTQAPNTPPAVKALLTGRYLPYTANSRLPDADTTIAECFARAGHRTGAFANSPWPRLVRATQGFQQAPEELWYDDRDPKVFAEELTDALVAWLSEAPRAPFLAYVHSIHPHNPYTAPPPWDRLPPLVPAEPRGTTALLLEAQRGEIELTQEDRTTLHRAYRRDILYNDHELQRLAAHLRRLGRLQDTVLAVVSDHGDEFGEHGGLLHGWTPFTEMIETPAVLWDGADRIPAHRIVRSRSENIDIFPTLATLAGLTPPPDVEGRSLLPELRGLDSRRSRAYSSGSSASGIYTILDGRYKYTYAPRNGQEVGIGEGPARVHERFFLYDVATDPDEQENIVQDRPVVASFLHRALESWLAAVGEAPTTPSDECPDCTDEEREILKKLGYLE